MSDYDNLIQRLISEANDTKYMLGHASSLHTAAADAINELVAERDALMVTVKALIDTTDKAEDDLAARAEKAEAEATLWLSAHDDVCVERDRYKADLAAARKALLTRKNNRQCQDCNALIEDGFDHEPPCHHYFAEDAAARAEGGE